MNETLQTPQTPPFPLERFNNALIRLKYANCCEEKMATQIGRVLKVAHFVTIRTGLIYPPNPYNPIHIEFRVKDWADFKTKIEILNKVQTRCHCPILYGDFHHAIGSLYYHEGNYTCHQPLDELMNMSWEGFP